MPRNTDGDKPSSANVEVVVTSAVRTTSIFGGTGGITRGTRGMGYVLLVQTEVVQYEYNFLFWVQKI